MTYDSVDQLQKALTESVFGYAQDSKKAAGRALGTIVEIIAFYLLESWGLNSAVSIETRIPEYGRPEITHNVEFSLHPVLATSIVEVEKNGSLTANRLLKAYKALNNHTGFERTNNALLSRDGVLRNACRIAKGNDSVLIATLADEWDEKSYSVVISQQHKKPFAIFECKRVGVEEGAKRGPQTIEKAKQGAYVARTVSSLQKVRLESGELYGVIYKDGDILISEPYHDLLIKVIRSNNPHLLKNFVLTCGFVSNHGNWFSADDHNKELKVLAQSYDWLVFLSDEGITEFLEDTVLNPSKEYSSIKDAFKASYTPGRRKNHFTKVNMSFRAHQQLLRYFATKASGIESWFNVISPANGSVRRLQEHIQKLRDRQWSEILT